MNVSKTDSEGAEGKLEALAGVLKTCKESFHRQNLPVVERPSAYFMHKVKKSMAQSQMAKRTKKFAATQGHLAAELHVARRTIGRWLKLNGNPGARRDGLYDVAAWQKFADAVSSPRGPAVPPEEKLRNLRLKNEKLEAEIAAIEREYTPRSEVNRSAALLAAEIAKIVRRIHSHAGELVGLSIPEAEIRLKEVEDSVLLKLHTINHRKDELI